MVRGYFTEGCLVLSIVIVCSILFYAGNEARKECVSLGGVYIGSSCVSKEVVIFE